MGSRITELDAQHLMFRQPAWHGFGRVGPITIGEAVSYTHLTLPTSDLV